LVWTLLGLFLIASLVLYYNQEDLVLFSASESALIQNQDGSYVFTSTVKNSGLKPIRLMNVDMRIPDAR
jgi:hypothetical protein